MLYFFEVVFICNPFFTIQNECLIIIGIIILKNYKYNNVNIFFHGIHKKLMNNFQRLMPSNLI